MEENVIAVVAGHKITEEEVTHYIQTLPREQQVYATQPQFRDYCKEQIIALYVLAEEGKEEKLDESEEFLTQIEKSKTGYFSTDGASQYHERSKCDRRRSKSILRSK